MAGERTIPGISSKLSTEGSANFDEPDELRCVRGHWVERIGEACASQGLSFSLRIFQAFVSLGSKPMYRVSKGCHYYCAGRMRTYQAEESQDCVWRTFKDPRCANVGRDDERKEFKRRAAGRGDEKGREEITRIFNRPRLTDVVFLVGTVVSEGAWSE